MGRIAGYVLILLGSLIMALAFWVWITSDYPDTSPFRIFGQFESGFWGLLQTQVNWLRVVIIGTPGLLFFQAGRHLVTKAKES